MGVLKYIVGVMLFSLAIVFFYQSHKEANFTRTHPKSHGLQGKGVMTNATLVDIISHRNRFSKLAMALRSTGLVHKLQFEGPFTIFAPTNRAFDHLDPREFNRLMKRGGHHDLSSIVRYHIVKGALQKSQLQPGDSLTTLQGAKLVISSSNGHFLVNGVQVESSNIKVSNGIIYAISHVLSPPK